jgi:hypothetical protein
VAIVNEPVPDLEETRDLLKELAAASERRHQFGRGTAEHEAALETEAQLRDRIWQGLVIDHAYHAE